MRTVVALLALVALAQAVSFTDIIKEEWHAFKLKHLKLYNSDTEERFRLKIFGENLHTIGKHNKLYAAGKVTFKLGLNKYADLLHQEIIETMNGYNDTLRKVSREKGLVGKTYIPLAHVTVPNSVDWRQQGAVTPVKDQGHCGSCWSFASTGALEGQHFRKTRALVSLSEQNLVDCSTKYGNNGCKGGWMGNAYSYIKNNGGIDTENAYPYKAVSESCNFNRNSVGATVSDFVDIPHGDEGKLMEAVAAVGPIAVAIDASHKSFHLYRGGIYNEPACRPDKLDHAVLVVGYGNENGQDYWLIKNSWSTGWGDHGYMKMLEHRKIYNSDTEERFRLKIFGENRHKIAKHNQLYAAGKVSFKLGLNKYADMLHHEFRETMNGYNNTLRKMLREQGLVGITFIPPAHVTVPKTVDWRQKGAVTPVKDQGHCGSCWSFSSTGALEGQHFRKSGVLVSLSEQNLVDCSTKYGNNGCNGGLMDNAFRYIKDNKGIDTEKAYPYEGIDDSCHFDKNSVGATDTGFVDIPEGDEENMMQAVATIGPVSVAIDASHESFQFYSEGVYNEPECNAQQLDHGVLVVGYGTDEKGQDYWLVKNSWGTTWGDKGFIKMARNQQNQCGIATASSYPTV